MRGEMGGVTRYGTEMCDGMNCVIYQRSLVLCNWNVLDTHSITRQYRIAVLCCAVLNPTPPREQYTG